MIALLLALSQTPDSASPHGADAYLDPAARVLVQQARAARNRNERLVTSYTATVRQRIGVGIRALSRDRMLFRQELVARINWRRDSASTIEMIGARQGIPVAFRGDHVPEDLDAQAASLVLNPAEDYLRLIGGDDDEGFIYPLREGGESDYRFASGDTTTITLQNGRRIRLLALKVIPRRADWRLMSGTLWFDGDTHGLVQVAFRPARPFEFRRDVSEADREDVPGFVNPTAEVKFITLEYGLYESRWWMPRYMALDATGSMGSWLNLPLRIERVYEDYEVEGGTPPPPGSTYRPAGTVRRRGEEILAPADSAARARIRDSLRAVVRACVDSVTALDRVRRRTVRVEVRTHDTGRELRREIRHCRRPFREDSNLVVVVPPDSLALLSSPELGPPILAMGDMISEAELRGLAAAIEQLPTSRPWDPRLSLPTGVSSLLQHARYNRVEALSLGLGGSLELGPVTLHGLGRIGAADLVPNGELALVRATPSARFSLGAYRRLAAANPETRPFGAVNSVLGLLAQRDDGEYFRTLGAEFTARNTNSGWWTLRIFAERQRPAEVETSASLPRLFSRDRAFRPNIVADSADQAGASLALRGTRALSRTLTLGGETSVDGAFGDHDLARVAGTLRLFVTPDGPLAGAVTMSAGTSTGSVPVQSRFYLGGPATLRGYAGGALSGPAYWTARGELGNSFPAARVTLFTDVGWAGERAGFWSGRPLIGVGVGGSVLDGLIRLDLSRGLRAPTGWRLDFYLDGIL